MTGEVGIAHDAESHACQMGAASYDRRAPRAGNSRFPIIWEPLTSSVMISTQPTDDGLSRVEVCG